MELFKSDSLYSVFFQVIRLHYHRSHILLDKIGVYPGQPPMLFALNQKDGQSQTQLSEMLNIKPATITVMLNRMEKEKLVERRRDPGDQRISRVYLTEKGKKLFCEVKNVVNNIEEECFKELTENERILLKRLLMQVRDNLHETIDKN